ncbi:recombination protein F [Neokomagataea thailandica NBRC 106555]|uniref:DNA replication and repair protein RecF n=1 Tax=Neokomagataea thailandica NBRC 106555 TaxID=1223520 RepID=A0ABQ0QRN8_9PROT|nr:recombination protein F [Neokomagataea thailandica NBRC 106555]
MPQLCRAEAKEWGVAATIRLKNNELVQLGTGAKSEEKRRSFVLDGRTIRSQAQAAPYFSCVWLTPQMDSLFQEGPSGRRRFLDRLVMALTPDHAREISAHERSISSRNRVLLEQPHAETWLSAIEDSIARHATAATASRLALVEHMNAHNALPSLFPKTRLTLDCPIAQHLKTAPALQVEDSLRAKLKATRAIDREQRMTSHGAHRADLGMADMETERPAHLSSSGQQRAILTGIVLSHAALMSTLKGQTPSLLLDEPLLHLDEKRCLALLETLKSFGSSVFLTGTDPQSFKALEGDAAFLAVKDGQVLTS